MARFKKKILYLYYKLNACINLAVSLSFINCEWEFLLLHILASVWDFGHANRYLVLSRWYSLQFPHDIGFSIFSYAYFAIWISWLSSGLLFIFWLSCLLSFKSSLLFWVSLLSDIKYQVLGSFKDFCIDTMRLIS